VFAFCGKLSTPGALGSAYLAVGASPHRPEGQKGFSPGAPMATAPITGQLGFHPHPLGVKGFFATPKAPLCRECRVKNPLDRQ